MFVRSTFGKIRLPTRKSRVETSGVDRSRLGKLPAQLESGVTNCAGFFYARAVRIQRTARDGSARLGGLGGRNPEFQHFLVESRPIDAELICGRIAIPLIGPQNFQDDVPLRFFEGFAQGSVLPYRLG